MTKAKQQQKKHLAEIAENVEENCTNLMARWQTIMMFMS